MSRHAGIQETEINYIQVLVSKPEGKKLLGKSRCRWENDIKAS
jgi:hypothetical protein